MLPSLETLRELVRACGLELTLGLAARDDSYARDATERLALAPPVRLARSLQAANAVRALSRSAERGQPAFDPLPALAALEEARIDFILIGSLAAVLRGSPLVPLDSTITIVPTEGALDRIGDAVAPLGAKRGDADGMWHLPKLAAELSAVRRPPGTFGWADLRRDATTVPAARGVQPLVASLADLVRIAEASPDPEQHAHVVALRTTLELARSPRLAASA